MKAKKVLALALALAMLLALLPTAVLGAETKTSQWVVEEVVPFQYDDIRHFSEGLAAVRVGDWNSGKWGFVDQSGKEVISCQYDYASYFSEGLAAVSIGSDGWGNGGKWGFVDQTGKEVISLQYDGALNFSNGLAAVCRSGKWGFINQVGQTVVAFQYDDIGWLSEGLRPVKRDSKLGFVDQTGKEVIPCQYDDAGYFSEGLASVWMDGKMGYINQAGEIVIPCKYYENAGAWTTEFRNGYALVGLTPEWNTKDGLLNKEGELIALGDYEQSYWTCFCEGLATVRRGGKWGFIDETGAEVIPCQYDDMSGYFDHGLAAVRTGADEHNHGGKYGFIDKTGKIVVPFKYDDAGITFFGDGWTTYYFQDGLAPVNRDGKWGYIDTTGVEVIPCQYDYASYFSEGLAVVNIGGDIHDCGFEGGTWGVIDMAGHVVVPCQYTLEYDYSLEWAPAVHDGYLRIAKGTGFGMISITKAGDPTSSPEPSESVKPSTKPSSTPSAKPSAAPVAVTGVSVAKTASVQVGKTKTLTATVKPSNANNKSVTWTSDDTYVVSVDTDGKITGVKTGTANVTVTTVDGGFTATCAVTVYTSSSGGGGGGSSSGGGGASGGGGGGGGATKPSAAPSAKPTIDTSKPASENFSDVVKDSWYESGVTYVVQKGLFNGVAQGQFAPQQNMTRAMLVTVLARLDGQDTAGGETWYAKATDWAKAQGVSDGTMLESSVTREQMVTMLYRYAKAQAGTTDLSAFSDGSAVSDWAKDAMAWAVDRGILTGKDGNRLDPQGTATRAEVATILQRFVENP